MAMGFRSFGYAAGLMAATFAAGCGSGLIKPHGQVLKNGEPYPLKKNESLWVTFHPQFEPPDHFAATAMPGETSFVATGRKGKGIPPGKYRIGVALVKYGSESDRLGGAFGPKNSPFLHEVLDDNEPIILDLGQPPG